MGRFMCGNRIGALVRQFIFVVLILAFPLTSFGQVRVLFSHQSVGRHVVGEPARAEPTLKATYPIRDMLNPGIAFWDHDYYNYITDIADPGTYVPGSLLDAKGEIFSTSGFGSHRGSGITDVLLDHLLSEAFSDTPDTDGRAFRDSCMSRFDIVMIKPGYRDLHMNTASSLADYQKAFEQVSDWWHSYNISHGTNKMLVVMTGSSLRHPSDYSIGTAGWEDTAAGHDEAESDVAAYRELDLWFQNVWAHRHPENRYFSTFELCVNLEGLPSEKYFTRDIFTGTGAGDDSGDHHLNAAGSNAIQDALVSYVNLLASQFAGDITPAIPSVGVQRVELFNPSPNPFNPTTTIAFELTEASPIRLAVYDISGKLVATLVDENRNIGRHEVYWNGRDGHGGSVSSGVYFVRIESGSYTQTKNITLVK